MSKKKTIEFVDVFEVFWDHVRRAEQDVRQNGHRGRLPPDCHNDPWDEDFAAAYEAVKRYLRKFRRVRFFPVPAGLAFRTGPIRAETAHQALMYFLNKPDELHGEVGVLDSPEYAAIKAEAIEELELRDMARRPRLRTKNPVRSADAKEFGQLATLRAFLMEYHFPQSGEMVHAPLTVWQIADKIGCSQSTATRKMQRLFPADKRDGQEKSASDDENCGQRNGSRAGGMAVYKAVFAGETPASGYRQKFEDQMLDVEAIWLDRRPWQE